MKYILRDKVAGGQASSENMLSFNRDGLVNGALTLTTCFWEPN